MKLSHIWVVVMYRWGDREKHSYVLGAYSAEERAIKEGNAERAWRGGKYDPEVLKLDVDSGDINNTGQVVLKLKDKKF